MLKKMTFLLFVAFCFSAGAQVVDGVDLSTKKDVAYIQVNVADAGKFTKTRWRCTVDYGQEPGKGQNFTILDAAGEPRLWVSHMEIINYFAGLGWVLLYHVDEVPGAGVKMDAYVFQRKT
jgi:hypothetical protein